VLYVTVHTGKWAPAFRTIIGSPFSGKSLEMVWHRRSCLSGRPRGVVSQNTTALIFLVCVRIPVDFVVLERAAVDFSVRKVFL